MSIISFVIFLVLLLGNSIFLALAVAAQPLHANPGQISTSRQQELLHLLKQDCGSCHGLTLEGGLGPALLPRNMANKPEQWLRQVILDGVPDTAMPAWRPLLSEVEVDWIVSVLKQGVQQVTGNDN